MKKEIIIFGTGALSGCFFNPYIQLNNDLIVPMTTGVLSVITFKKIQRKLNNQYKKNTIRSFVRNGIKEIVYLTKEAKKYKLKMIFKEHLFTSFVLLETFMIYLSFNDFNFTIKHHLLNLPISLFIVICTKSIYKMYKIRRIEYILDHNYNGKIIVSNLSKSNITLCSLDYLTDNDKPKISMAINATITGEIIQHKFSKNHFTFNFIKGKEEKYTRLTRGSLERLEQILIDSKFKPQYKNTINYDNCIIHYFILNMNPRRIKYILQTLENKLGVKHGNLHIESNNGYFEFHIKHENNMIYILDDIIGSVLPKNEELGFIVGINQKNSNPIIKDIVSLNHLLIAGKSGSGKSTTFKCIIESLMYYNPNKIMWLMLDFGESALSRYQNFINVKYMDLYDDNCRLRKDQIAEEIQITLIEEIKRRKLLFKREGVEKLSEYNQFNPDSELPYIIFTVDEANGFKNMMRLKDDDELVQDIFHIFTQGRKYGIFIIMAVQQTNDKTFFKDWKTQTTRLTHLLTESVDVINATGNSELTSIIPNLKTGEFILDHKDTDKYEILKGTLTDRNHDNLYKILKKGFNKNVEIIKKINLEKKSS